MAQEARSVQNRTYEIVTIGFANRDGSPLGDSPFPSPEDRFYIDFQPAHHVAVATLAGMFALTLPTVVRQLRRGDGRRRDGG
jgi:hypothetical protein